MKILLNVKDDKAELFMKMLRKLPYVKFKPLLPIHFKILDEAIGIVDDIELIEQGKQETRTQKSSWMSYFVRTTQRFESEFLL